MQQRRTNQVVREHHAVRAVVGEDVPGDRAIDDVDRVRLGEPRDVRDLGDGDLGTGDGSGVEETS